MPHSDPNNKDPLEQWLVSNIPNSKATRIIEIGPGAGQIGQVVKRAIPSAKIDAIEVFGQYVSEYSLHSIYNNVIVDDVRRVPNDFFRGADLVLWIDGPEHMTEHDSSAQLQRIAGQTRYGVIANTPRFEYPQDALDGNEHMRHLSTWNIDVWVEHGANMIWEGDVTHMWWFRGLPGSMMHGTDMTVAYIVGDDEDEDDIFQLSMIQATDVAKQIVVVDTSKDGSPTEIAEGVVRYFPDIELTTDRFSWTGNFSDARNRMLDLCNRDWIFVLDADELMDDSICETYPEFLRRSFLCYSMPTYHYVRNIETGKVGWHRDGGWYPDPHIRILRNDKRIRYTGAVHEVPTLIVDGEDVGWPTGSVGTMQAHLHHYGWARYEELLMRKIEKRYQIEIANGIRQDGEFDYRRELHDGPWIDYHPVEWDHPGVIQGSRYE